MKLKVPQYAKGYGYVRPTGPPSVTNAVQQGTIHPIVRTISRIISDEGWRVVSILRPDGNHSSGIALDVAPFTLTSGGFGPRTARAVFQTLEDRGLWRTHPEARLFVLCEPDHIHIQLNDVNIIGLQYPVSLMSGSIPKLYKGLTITRALKRAI